MNRVLPEVSVVRAGHRRIVTVSSVNVVIVGGDLAVLGMVLWTEQIP